MNIKTSYVMTDEVHELLREAEQKTGRDVASLLVDALRMMLNQHKKYSRNRTQIEYQKRYDETTGEPVKKHRVKVKLMEAEYVLFQDARRFFRRSISLLFAIVVLSYLDELVEVLLCKEYRGIQDNYPGAGYTYYEKCTEFAVNMTIWFGVPPDWEQLYT